MASTTKLWDNELIEMPENGWGSDSRIFTSATVTPNNDTKAKAIIQLHDLDPDADAEPGELGNYLLRFVIEESLDNGDTWTVVASQFEQLKGTKKAEKHIIEISDRINLEAGSILRLGDGLSAISQTQGEIQDNADYRVSCLRSIVNEGSLNPDLQSVNLTCTFQTW